MLTGKRWPRRVYTNAVLAMAGRAGCRLVKGSTVGAPGRNGVTTDTGEIGRDICDLLVGQARCLGLHCRVLARSGTVALKGNLEVPGFLATEFRHAVRGVGITVAFDAVAPKTGVCEVVAGRGIAFSVRGLREWCHRQEQCRDNSYDLHVRNHLVNL